MGGLGGGRGGRGASAMQEAADKTQAFANVANLKTVEMGTHYQMSALMSSRVNLTTDAITDWEPKGPGIFYTRAKLAF